jgi:hypothetical protein
VDSSGRACIADFGLSSVTDTGVAYWTSHSVGSKGGTTRWQAPELNDPENDHSVPNTKESDVYAWSCVCYEVCRRLKGCYFITLPMTSIDLHWMHPLLRVSSESRPFRHPQSQQGTSTNPSCCSKFCLDLLGSDRGNMGPHGRLLEA